MSTTTEATLPTTAAPEQHTSAAEQHTSEPAAAPAPQGKPLTAKERNLKLLQERAELKRKEAATKKATQAGGESLVIKPATVEQITGKPAQPSAPAKTKDTPKPPPAKAEAKKDTAKTPAKVAKTPEYGVTKAKDVPWCRKKVLVLRALKQLKATDRASAATVKQILTHLAKSGEHLKPRDGRHYCYHAITGGYVQLVETEGAAGYSFFLTPAGVAEDYAKRMKEVGGK